jgi:hypothetical protein
VVGDLGVRFERKRGEAGGVRPLGNQRDDSVGSVLPRLPALHEVGDCPLQWLRQGLVLERRDAGRDVPLVQKPGGARRGDHDTFKQEGCVTGELAMSKSRDNIPGFVFDRTWKALLIPGVVIQWFMYMNPQRGMSGVAGTSRRARSPIMTYWYSFMFYAAVIYLIYIGWSKAVIWHNPADRFH